MPAQKRKSPLFAHTCVTQVIISEQKMVVPFLKFWQQPQSWELQLGPAWRKVDAQRMIDACDQRRSKGTLLRLLQPKVRHSQNRM